MIREDHRDTITDHADASAEVLERYAHLIRMGKSPEDAARELLPIIRIMARQT